MATAKKTGRKGRKPALGLPRIKSGVQKPVVLSCLRDGATISEAAEAAGVDRGTVYRWQQADPDFRAAYAEAWEAGAIRQEEILQRCAAKAEGDPRYQTSLIFSLKNRTGGRYRDMHDHRHSGSLTIEGLLEQLDAEDAAE